MYPLLVSTGDTKVGSLACKTCEMRSAHVLRILRITHLPVERPKSHIGEHSAYQARSRPDSSQACIAELAAQVPEASHRDCDSKQIMGGALIDQNALCYAGITPLNQIVPAQIKSLEGQGYSGNK